MDDSAADDTTTTTSTGGGRDNRWTREASRNTALAAAEIYFIACPSDRLPWRDVLKLSRVRGQQRGGASTSLEDLFARPPPPPEGWAGQKGKRRRRGTGPVWKGSNELTASLMAAAAAAPVEAVAKAPHRMDSPTTPLSWTNAAVSSGSGSGSASGSGSGGCSVTREDDAITTAAAATPPPTMKAAKRQRSDAEGNAYATPAAASTSSDSVAAAVGAIGRSVLALTDSSGTTADGALPMPSSAGVSGYASISKTARHLLGKKMTFVELKSVEQSLLHENMEMRKTFMELKTYEQSLLQKNVQMHKELEIQREAQKAQLVEENTRQKKLKSKPQHQPQPQPRPVKQASSSHRDEQANCGKGPFLLFDLNVPATEDIET